MTTDRSAPQQPYYKPLFPENWVGSSWTQRLLLAALFTLSFILPLAFGLRMISGWFPSEAAQVEESDPVFPENITVQSQGAFLRISESPVLSPQPDKDYILAAWFNLKRVPQAGEDMSLISKVDHSHPFKPGFSLALSRHGSLVRPVIYWKDSQGKGGWYNFSEVRIVPRTWFSFVISVYGADRIGLHMVTIEEGQKPKRDLLGGFQLSVPVYPVTKEPLYVGSLQSGSFRGKIGPISVFSGKNLHKDFKDILKEISRDPLSIPSDIKPTEVMLWCPDGRNDRSSYNHPITRSKAAERGSRAQSE